MFEPLQQTVLADSHQSLAIHPGQILTITADANSRGKLWRIADPTAPATGRFHLWDIAGSIEIAPGETRTVEPFRQDRTRNYLLEVAAGSLTYRLHSYDSDASVSDLAMTMLLGNGWTTH